MSGLIVSLSYVVFQIGFSLELLWLLCKLVCWLLKGWCLHLELLRWLLLRLLRLLKHLLSRLLWQWLRLLQGLLWRLSDHLGLVDSRGHLGWQIVRALLVRLGIPELVQQ